MIAFFQINYVAVFVAGLIYYGLGALWYGKALFGDAWIKASGMTSMASPNMSMTGSMIWLLISSLLTSLGIAYVIKISGKIGIANGIEKAIVIALLFGATIQLPIWVIMGKGTLYLIDFGYLATGLIIMGAIIGAWQK
ncbi:MAG: hypothetical protein A2539_05585 [Elusimicrobia bacterium RIFOXYD2_FULL_34_15]|nr:MAG: hypothetical protein A2539_05585 [Elusimicrobia bacterium RIFOXYD2_FULL_34_15]